MLFLISHLSPNIDTLAPEDRATQISADAQGLRFGQVSWLLSFVSAALVQSATIARPRSCRIGTGIIGEVLSAHNGYIDGSQQISEHQGVRVVLVKRRAPYSALLHGIRAVRGRYVILGDSGADSWIMSNATLSASRGSKAEPLIPRCARSPTVAVLIRCYNEAAAIGKVLADFRAALPEATIYVYDINSADGTIDETRAR